MALKTLDDAFNGLLQYWQFRPNGGTRAELIQLATSQGFVEPVLNQWLDAFLGGCVTLGLIANPDYSELAARVATVSFEVAKDRAQVVYDYLLAGRDLDPIAKANLIQVYDASIATLDDRLANIDQGVVFAQANFPPGDVLDHTVEATQRGRAYYQSQRNGQQKARDVLAAELAAESA